jgi:hypothetical protein
LQQYLEELEDGYQQLALEQQRVQLLLPTHLLQRLECQPQHLSQQQYLSMPPLAHPLFVMPQLTLLV